MSIYPNHITNLHLIAHLGPFVVNINMAIFNEFIGLSSRAQASIADILI
jgi:hypothetical protein